MRPCARGEATCEGGSEVRVQRSGMLSDTSVAGFARQVRMLVPVVFLELPVVILFALYPGLVSLSQLAR